MTVRSASHPEVAEEAIPRVAPTLPIIPLPSYLINRVIIRFGVQHEICVVVAHPRQELIVGCAPHPVREGIR